MELDFASPKPDNEPFNEYWELFIPSVKERENLKPPHLYQLRILCDLCVRRDYLELWLQEKGETYISEGRNGIQWKPYPQVQMLSNCDNQIRNYSKILGLVLVKDTEMTKGKKKNQFEEEGEEEDE